MRYIRNLQQMLRQAEAAVQERRRTAEGGVYVCQDDEEFAATADWPRAKPGETGKLIVPRQLTMEEWAERSLSHHATDGGTNP